MPDAVARFASFAAEYDAARPQPPAELTEVLMQWSGTVAPDVVDVGAGTGLSSGHLGGPRPPGHGGRAGRADAHRGADPAGPDPGPRPARWRTRTTRRPSRTVPAAGAPTRFAVVAGSAEETGLPDACADIVTASQAMHWFDAARALPEIARILRPGGVFAAYDCDWPPCIDWETDAAYVAFDRRVRELETARGLRPPHAGKHAPGDDRRQRAVPVRHRGGAAAAGSRATRSGWSTWRSARAAPRRCWRRARPRTSSA